MLRAAKVKSAAGVTCAVTTALCLHTWQQQMRGYNRAPFTRGRFRLEWKACVANKFRKSVCFARMSLLKMYFC